MDLTKYIDIFASGTHTDAGGHTRTWSTADLDTVVNSFDEAKRRVPLVLGHPKTDAPAWGWVQELRRVGPKLQASFRQVPEALKTAVEQGRYKNISIRVGRDGALRHVGMLGAAQPSVPGLAPVEFADAEDDATYEYSFQTEGTHVNEEQLKAKIAELEAKVAELEKKLATAEADKEKIEADFAEFKDGQVKATRTTRVDQLIKDGKILPAERSTHLNFAEAIAGSGQEMDFAEADGKSVKLPAEEAYWRELERRPVNAHGLFSEQATEERSGGNTETTAYEDLSGKA